MEREHAQKQIARADNNNRTDMPQKTKTGLVRPGPLPARRIPSPGIIRGTTHRVAARAIALVTVAMGLSVGAAAPSLADDETSREVRRYGTSSTGGTGNACIRLLRQRGVTFTRLPDKKPKRPGGCGYENAVEVTAIGSVKMRRPVRVRCEVAARLEWWLRERIQPTAVQTFGQPIKEMDTYSGYSCRNAFGLFGGRRVRRLSQHGRANALDIGGFVLENGEKIDYQVHWKKAVRKPEGATANKVYRAGTPRGPLRGWRAKYDRRKDPLFNNKDYFLRKISFAACSIFNKVFTPDYDYHHRHHIHIDLASAKLCGYASPRNHRMTAAAQGPTASGGGAVALAAFRNSAVKFKDRSVSFVTRKITRRPSGPSKPTTLISAAEDRYTGPDRGAAAKAEAEARRQQLTAAKVRQERQAQEARNAAAQRAKAAERRTESRDRMQVASRPSPRPTEQEKPKTDRRPGSKSNGISRVIGILLGRKPAERRRPEPEVASRTAGTDAAKIATASGGSGAGPVVGLGRPGGNVIVTPRPRGVAGQAPPFQRLTRRAAVLLD